jgi:serine/threonine protein kinase/Tfp pilus assembly protein PilF
MSTEPARQDGDVTGDFDGSAASPPPSPEQSPNATAGATGVYQPVPPAPVDPGQAAGAQVSGLIAEPDDGPTFDPHRDAGLRTGAYVLGTHAGKLAPTEFAGATGAYDPNAPSSFGDGSAAVDAVPMEARCGRYRLKHFHAKGGMGEIWLAEDTTIGRPVALKRMLGRHKNQQHRFRVEAQVTGQLEHPGIVPIHELGTTEDGLPFYTMKFVRGRTLQAVIQEFHKSKLAPGARDVERVRLLQNFISLCQTVAYAHSKGVLHRDLKPENVMLGPYGETLLLDWGIAKVMDQPEAAGTDKADFVHLEEADDETGTRAGAVIGSPSYMSPEIAAGLNAEADQRSDVFLLGATLYEILTGKLPRQGKSALDMITRAQKEAAVPARKIKPDVPRALEAICQKAMAMRKEDRYQSALALAEDVQRYVAGEPVSAYREGPLQRAWRWAKRHRIALARTASVLLLLGLSWFGYATWRDIEDRRIAAEEKRVAAQREADREKRRADLLKEQDQARHDLKEFHQRADEARFYLATTDAVAANAPYFDPRQGEARIKATLAFAADKWGSSLDKLPLTEEVQSVKNEKYDLLLLLASRPSTPSAGGEKGPAPAGARETLVLLTEAGELRTPSRNYYQLRARAHRQLGDHKQAAADEQQAANPDTPTTALDHFLLGEQYRRQAAGAVEGQKNQKVGAADPQLTAKAVDAYRQALQSDPNHYWSHLQLARSHMSVGRYAEAVEVLGACVALKPDSPWAFSVRGTANLLQKHLPEAKRDLDKAVKLDGDAPTSRLNRGVAYWSLHRDADALRDFDVVLALPPEKRLVEAAFYRGQLYLQQGEVQKALDDFDLVVRENPLLQRVYLHRARIHIAQGNNDKALADVDAFLAAGHAPERDGWELHGLRGSELRNIYTELPEDERQKKAGQAMAALAVAELQAAVEKGGRKAVLFEDLGAMLELTGKLDDAIAAYSKGLELAPRNVVLLNLRGMAYLNTSQFDKALPDFSAAVAIEPLNAEAHSGVGFVRAVNKLPVEAQQSAELALLFGTELRAPKNYLNLHNVAGIYAALSATGDRQARAHQDVAMALLQRAVALWEKEGTGPDEIEQIKSDDTFKPLSGRDDFQKLINRPKKK